MEKFTCAIPWNTEHANPVQDVIVARMQLGRGQHWKTACNYTTVNAATLAYNRRAGDPDAFNDIFGCRFRHNPALPDGLVQLEDQNGKPFVEMRVF